MTYKYEIIIYWSEEDDAFIAEVPELTEQADRGIRYRGAWRLVGHYGNRQVLLMRIGQ